MGVDALDDINQQLVPDKMSPGVIHGLKAIEIEEDNRVHAARVPGLTQSILQQRVHLMAIGKASQGVIARLDL
ncbi:hypothetical protein D3C79_1066690 [compost metagenome]